MSDPYAPPAAAVRAASIDVPDAVEIRTRHLRYESALLGLGWWCYFLGVLQLAFGVMCASLVIFFIAAELPPDDLPLVTLVAMMGVLAVLGLGFGGLCTYSAWGVRSFAPEARIPALINSGIQVTNFPFGMIAGVAGLYLLLLPESRAVLSHDYADVRAATPELKPGWHPLLLALPATILISVLGLVVIVVFSVALAV
ncbi:MAG: hypothetical protein ACI8S6_002753 [Myxococcota bacterium]|jgi:hypothetical protein